MLPPLEEGVSYFLSGSIRDSEFGDCSNIHYTNYQEEIKKSSKIKMMAIYFRNRTRG